MSFTLCTEWIYLVIRGGYCDNEIFLASRNRGNIISSPLSQTCILRDKLLFYRYMSSIGMPVPKVFALVSDGVLMDLNFSPIDDSILYDKKDYFIKDNFGECASFVQNVYDFDSFQSIRPLLGSGCYILQEAIQQNHEMDKLNPKAINTLRVVTINRNRDVFVLASLLRIGTCKTGNVDNWARGGIAIGIATENGQLKQYGFLKPSYNTEDGIGRLTEHPDTGVVFKDFCIPYYQYALSLACRAHKGLDRIHSIGWDIAITPNGPSIIEGNDNWEISLMQVCDRPLKREWFSKL